MSLYEYKAVKVSPYSNGKFPFRYRNIKVAHDGYITTRMKGSTIVIPKAN